MSGLSIQEFWSQYSSQPYELIQGQPCAQVSKEYVHEVVCSRIRLFLDVFVETNYLGEVLGDQTRFALADNEVRAADIAFVSHAKISQIRDPESYLPFAPDLMVEVVSARFTSTQIQEKVYRFLDGGTQLAWIVDPVPREITVIDADGGAETLTQDENISGQTVLPGLLLRVDDLFPPLDTTLRYSYT